MFHSGKGNRSVSCLFGLFLHSPTIYWCGGVRNRFNLDVKLGYTAWSRSGWRSMSLLSGSVRVKFSYKKALVSHRGSAEFIKHFWVKGLSVDLSSVSIWQLLKFSSPIWTCGNLAQRIHVDFRLVPDIEPSTPLDHRRNYHFERVFVMRMKIKLPFPLWLSLSTWFYVKGKFLEWNLIEKFAGILVLKERERGGEEEWKRGRDKNFVFDGI